MNHRHPVNHLSHSLQNPGSFFPSTVEPFIVIGTGVMNDYRKEQEDITKHLSLVRKDPSYNRRMQTEVDWIPALLPIGNYTSRSAIPLQACKESKRLHAGRGRHLNQHSTTKTPSSFFSHLSTKPAAEELWINIARFLLLFSSSSNSYSTPFQRHHTSTNNTPQEAGTQHQQDFSGSLFSIS